MLTSTYCMPRSRSFSIQSLEYPLSWTLWEYQGLIYTPESPTPCTSEDFGGKMQGQPVGQGFQEVSSCFSPFGKVSTSKVQAAAFFQDADSFFFDQDRVDDDTMVPLVVSFLMDFIEMRASWNKRCASSAGGSFRFETSCSVFLSSSKFPRKIATSKFNNLRVLAVSAITFWCQTQSQEDAVPPKSENRDPCSQYSWHWYPLRAFGVTYQLLTVARPILQVSPKHELPPKIWRVLALSGLECEGLLPHSRYLLAIEKQRDLVTCPWNIGRTSRERKHSNVCRTLR